jgi:hypothetical protein
MRRTIRSFNPRRSYGCMICIGALFILVGMPFLIFGILQKRFENSVSTWKATNGILLRDELAPIGGRVRRDVLYSFKDERGIQRTNSSIGIGFDGNHNRDFPRVIGTPCPVLVWYNPQNPLASALVRKSRGTGFLLPLGGMWVVSGFALLFSVIHARKKRSPQGV